MNIYLSLTQQLNEGRLRAIISSGQAVVLHRLAIMSKDGDWIVREDEECLDHLLSVLSAHGATYRFGAPLDVRWMAGGWSSHLQFRAGKLRVRTDFVTRPPRLTAPRLAQIWQEQGSAAVPFLSASDLADIKKTNRERDYAIIGELARLMTDVREQLLYSRSARDLIQLAAEHPSAVRELTARRPLLAAISQGRSRLEEALDAERRQLIHANEARLEAYLEAAEEWAGVWLDTERRGSGLPLQEAHRVLVDRAEGVLPFHVRGGGHGQDPR